MEFRRVLFRSLAAHGSGLSQGCLPQAQRQLARRGDTGGKPARPGRNGNLITARQPRIRRESRDRGTSVARVVPFTQPGNPGRVIGMNAFKNILYVAESSVAQQASILRAVSLAENNQADLTVIDVVPGVAAGMIAASGGHASAELQAVMVGERRKQLEALIEPYRTRLDIRLDVLVGRTFLEAIRMVLRNGHDLLIKPAENPGFMQRLFGSIDMQLLRNCPCPLWLTRENEKEKYENILAAVDFDPDLPDAVEHDLNQQIL